MTGPIVQFDRGPAPARSLFQNPIRIIEAWDADDVPDAFRSIEDAQKTGFWLVGFAGYELGVALIPKLRSRLPATQTTPLLQFGVFEAPTQVRHADTNTSGAGIDALTPQWAFARYRRAFDAVHEFLRQGDIYQANLTFPLSGRYHGAPHDLYTALCANQTVPHGAYLDLGGPVLLSRSRSFSFHYPHQATLRHAR